MSPEAGGVLPLLLTRTGQTNLPLGPTEKFAEQMSHPGTVGQGRHVVAVIGRALVMLPPLLCRTIVEIYPPQQIFAFLEVSDH